MALLQLMQTKGIGPRTLGAVLAKLSQEGRTPEDLVSAPAEELTRFGLKPPAARAVAAGRDQAERVASELARANVRILVRGTAGYPTRLVQVLGAQAPPLLFVAGNAALLERRAVAFAVAFAGARDASDDGLGWTHAAAQQLAKRAVNVVSGHANGVDLAAHRAALAAGGTTALVLAEGILRFRAKPDLAELLDQDCFAVVSEFPPRLPWSIGNAMHRNATVCALADALVVVEAGATGGTFAAGQTALELRQPLFVLTYARPPASAAGNAALLRQGGHPLVYGSEGGPDLTALFRALETWQTVDCPQEAGRAHPTLIQRGLFDDAV